MLSEHDCEDTEDLHKTGERCRTNAQPTHCANKRFVLDASMITDLECAV